MPAKLTSLYDNIVLPRADHYILVNFLLFRAGMKLKRSQADISIYKTPKVSQKSQLNQLLFFSYILILYAQTYKLFCNIVNIKRF
jgi:hypothetical protein